MRLKRQYSDADVRSYNALIPSGGPLCRAYEIMPIDREFIVMTFEARNVSLADLERACPEAMGL